MNYIKFMQLARKNHAAPLKNTFLRSQYGMLKSGVRGVEIHAACWNAYTTLNNK